jgi:hypothetical protein
MRPEFFQIHKLFIFQNLAYTAKSRLVFQSAQPGQAISGKKMASFWSITINALVAVTAHGLAHTVPENWIKSAK